MDRYIGLDVHTSSCTLAVVGPSRKRLGTRTWWRRTHGL